MISSFRNSLGWSSKQRIIVFESDDWGSDRFSDKAIRDYYIKKGYPIEKCWMSFVDNFESNQDAEEFLALLYEQGSQGKSRPKCTFLFNPANPDFEKIGERNFQDYYYESFQDRVVRSPNSEKLIHHYRKAIEEGVLEVAFHGREHLYVNRWLRDLQAGESEIRNGFDHNFWGYSKSYYPRLKHSYRSSFALDHPEDLSFQRQSIKEGVALIEDIFEKSVRYFLAPDGPFSLSLLPALKSSGIEYIGLSKNFRDAATQKRRLFWLGKKLRNGMRVITRNASFEPASPRETDWVDKCLADIKNAFQWRKPAVISTHRANYVGGLELANRDNSLKSLSLLLKKINQIWPEALFMTSSQLGDVISGKLHFDETG